MVQNLFGELDIALSAPGTGIVAENGLAEAWRLREPDASWNDSTENLVAEKLTQIRRYSSNLNESDRKLLMAMVKKFAATAVR